MEVGAKICNGEIIIIDGCNNETITIKARKHINLFINDKPCEIYKVYEVTSNDKITYTCDTVEAKREANITISQDKMKAYLNVKYTPEIKYKLKEREAFLNLALAAEEEYTKQLPSFTIHELKDILKKHKVVYGINDNALDFAIDGTEEDILVAEGLSPVKNIPSEIKLFFNPTKMVFPEENSDEKVDYKNLFRISNVNIGDKIAEIIPEVPGKDGMNVLGQVVKREYIRTMPINAVKGCKIENNDIISLIDGKAHIVNRNISVNPVFSVEKVNMETCNIKFYGDIEVYDTVDDNMSVNAGGSLDVSKNVNTSHVITGGEITIVGNAFNSKILSGQIDIRKKEYSDVLVKFKEIVEEMKKVIHEVKYRSYSFNLSELIIILTEGRFSDFQKVALKIITLNVKNKIKHNKLAEYLKDYVLGYNILKLKSINDLNRLMDILENEIEYYDKNVIVPLDIRIGYCQDCEIKSTGNIIINGEGEYISYLTAMKDIMFTKSDSVARGGVLSSGGTISAGIVGSEAKIPTKLCVPKHGRINATFAYENTIFCFGNKSKIIEDNYENINVFFDSNSQSILIVSSGL